MGPCALREGLQEAKPSGTWLDARMLLEPSSRSDHAPRFDRSSNASLLPSRSQPSLLRSLPVSTPADVISPRCCRPRRPGARGRRATRRPRQRRARREGARRALWRRALASSSPTMTTTTKRRASRSGPAGASQAGACWTWRAAAAAGFSVSVLRTRAGSREGAGVEGEEERRETDEQVDCVSCPSRERGCSFLFFRNTVGVFKQLLSLSLQPLSRALLLFFFVQTPAEPHVRALEMGTEEIIFAH